MELAASKTYATARQLTLWTAEDDADLSAKLLLAADYLAQRFTFKATLSPAEQAKYDAAHFRVAYDFLVNGNPATRAERFTTVEINELSGVGKTEREFAEIDYEPYPGLAEYLAPITLTTSTASLRIGRLVR